MKSLCHCSTSHSSLTGHVYIFTNRALNRSTTAGFHRCFKVLHAIKSAACHLRPHSIDMALTCHSMPRLRCPLAAPTTTLQSFLPSLLSSLPLALPKQPPLPSVHYVLPSLRHPFLSSNEIDDAPASVGMLVLALGRVFGAKAVEDECSFLLSLYLFQVCSSLSSTSLATSQWKCHSITWRRFFT